MVSKSLIALVATLATVWAQSTTEDSTATAEETASRTSTAAEKTHTVNVGASGHKFTPAELDADVGDIIEWRFYPTDHWVIRGDYDNPCIPYEYIDYNRKGFSSGTQKVQAITEDAPRFRVRVNDTKPFVFYCGAPGSCVNYKMMGIVNPSKNETLKGLLDNAKDVDYQLRPGDEWPKEHGDPSSTATPGKDDEDSDNSDSGSGSGKKSLSTGAIAGIAVGGAAVLLLAGALLYLCGRRGGFDKAYRKSFRSSAIPPGPPVVEQSVYSPHQSVADPWGAQKSPGLVATPYSQTQSPPMSPHQSLAYGTHPGMVNPDGSPMMYQDGQQYQYHDHYAPPPMAASPVPSPKPQEVAPVELPGSPDPGYNNNNNHNNNHNNHH
ncbi:hypothetical protein SNK03_011578 [Fusarium graminearum]|uniref:Chromosome 3, complete genome n=2 Tax=Gibberella zeae TaxID=5518 RepID=I1RNM3_GIBZE|nr:hypothetical protein FGSG_05606 [Fusarium graminearum PH-1]EYB29464.1 hypothetical protein FG05_05606 [Fusarium graminearum]ESU11590.1 hypothetical protein FGSG_05606 [Fusarium graminearum PH-1]KAI6757123.1 hypothetical protein HG531_002948 [Fusarium graminearum]PCD31684.1 hypothetical protein FGRA07_09683 [Fusarium graminearum]CAF3463971.1 unnamed protein product [Fusarium graminearum]|eukprot:XP_011324166.1 hypothetical protein FGSG_05606 [Fusarium graminearum PH-1]